MAQQAYTDLINNFWDAPTGHFVQNVGDSGSATPTTGNFWAYGMGVFALYAAWKHGLPGESQDALARLTQQWTWTAANWTLPQVSVCGVGTTSTAQDDAAWGASELLEMAEATGNATALTYAKAVIDCGWSRWEDSTLGGGLWYNDAHFYKTAYQGQFAWAAYRYYQMTGNTTYLTEATSIDSWAATALQRAGQTFMGYVYPNDGLYWIELYPSGQPLGDGPGQFNTPDQVSNCTSVVMLEGQMAFADLEARLYAAGNTSYLSRIEQTLDGMAAIETVNGVYLNDRDANVEGVMAVEFATDVLPIIDPTRAAQHTALFVATAQSLPVNDRTSTGTYGALWQGPLTSCWSSEGVVPSQVVVSTQAVMMAIAGWQATQ